jgi:ubiquinone/menaquinone biosynthesis C-methylase UbiE
MIGGGSTRITMHSISQLAPSPFDTIAQEYDEMFTDSFIGRAQRRPVWDKLGEVFQAGTRILEINCGTGVDAVHLAQMGVEVLALDSSAGMIAATRRRLEKELGGRLVSAQLLAIENLDQLRNAGSFDGAFSNFGGLNCVSNLRKVSKDLARLLKPGSPVLFCLMGPWCCWEILYYLIRRDPQKAFRRMSKGGVVVQFKGARNLRPDDDSISVAQPSEESVKLHVHYPSADQLAQAFAPYFRFRSCQAIGLMVPPSYAEPWIARHPRFLKLAAALDTRISHWPGIRNLGDHYLVQMERL